VSTPLPALVDRPSMRSGFLYTAGRLFAVGTKPAYLFAANNLLGAGTAAQLATTFLFSSLMLIAVAAGPERLFYLRVFGAARVNGLPFHLYVASTVLLIAAGFLVDATALLLTLQLPLLACVGAVFFVSEKVADESLRWHLFQKDFAAWGGASIARGALQLVSLALLYFVAGRTVSAVVLVSALAASNLVVFRRAVPRRWPAPAAARSLLRRAIGSLLRNRRIWVIALLTASVGYVDRFVILFVEKARLPIFMLVVMCFSITYMAIDFYYVSRHRRDFLERRITIGGVFRASDFVGALAGGLVVSVSATVVTLLLSAGGREFPLQYVVAIALFQTCISLAIIPREIIYWGDRPQTVIKIELAFWSAFVLAAGGAWLAAHSVGAILATAVVCGAIRLWLYVVAAAGRGVRALP